MNNSTGPSEICRLLVPIHIDALVQESKFPPAEIFQWTNLAADFSKLRNDYCFGVDLVSDGNLFEEAADLEQGVHLHFQMPHALTHGNQREAADVLFPPLPNRWLVQRCSGNRDEKDKWSHKAWLIRSDAEPKDGDQNGSTTGTTWPIFMEDKENITVEFMRLGACTELTEPLAEKDEHARIKITAVGPGDPAFSAFYPACRGILGFHDPLTDITADSGLSYLVTGWYSHSEDDPLSTFLEDFCKNHPVPKGDITPEWQECQFTAFKTWAEEHGWEIADQQLAGTSQNFTLPTRLLFHGFVRGIRWPKPEKSAAGTVANQSSVFPPNINKYEEEYKIAVGNTPAEAVAALFAQGSLDQDLLTALQDDMLSQPVTAAEMQYGLHERRFSGIHGGTIFQIREEPDQPETGTVLQPPKQVSEKQIAAELRGQLHDLNASQRKYDEISRRMEDCRWQVYALWYLRTSAKKAIGSQKRKEELKEQLDKALEALKAERAAWNSSKEELERKKVSINVELGKHPKTLPDGTVKYDKNGKIELQYRLMPTSAAPFLRPNDPGVAIYGPAMGRINSIDIKTRDGRLKCRISGNEVTGIKLQVPGERIVEIKGEDLIKKTLGNFDALPVFGIHRNLLDEALLLDGRLSSVIAEFASNDLINTVKKMQNPESTEALEKPPEKPNELRGIHPDATAMFDWAGNPWTPLFLVWEVMWRSDYDSPGKDKPLLPENLITSRWVFGDNAGSGLDCDLNLNPNLIPMNYTETSIPEGYQGYSILMPGTRYLDALKKANPLLNIPNEVKIQTVTLDGFNDALILQQPGMQLPPLDLDKWRDSGSHYLDHVHADINDGFEKRFDTFRTAPYVRDVPFLPIRTGRLEIRRLSIVDAFGQTLKLIKEKTNDDVRARMLLRAHSCVVSASQSETNDHSVVLRPRFALPMHLLFQWENAATGLEKDYGPVCGWIIPNHLEKSLMVYSANGIPLGALQKKLDLKPGSSASGFYWSDIPREGDEGKVVVGKQDVQKHLTRIIENTHLCYFCEWALSLDPDDVGIIIDDAMASSDQRVPEDDPGVSVLLGRPLVLVRASLQFETPGLPAHRPELRSVAGKGVSFDSLLDTGDFQKVRWPLRLGDLHTRNDGLIGVFKCSPGDTGDTATGGPFYPVWGQNIKRQNGAAADVQDFEIDAARPLHVTMLMDPQARVHVTTGALPRMFIELPPEHMTGARRAREVFFQTAPVLLTSVTLQMPKPSDDYGEWSWAYRPDVTGWKLDPNIVEATDRASTFGNCPSIAEGLLKLMIAPVRVLSFWVREGVEAVESGTRIVLAWSLQGAESLVLEEIQKDGKSIVLKKWNAPPFPREYPVTVVADTLFRISAFAEESHPSIKELSITITGNNTP